MQKESKSELVVTSALTLAATFLLGLIKISSPWVYGGSVTLFSMVPIIIISFKMGAKIGFMLGINYGILKLILGTSNFIFLNFKGLLCSIILDYLLAYGFIGAVSFFRVNNLRNKKCSFYFSIIIVFCLRYLCHVISGIFVWRAWLIQKVSTMNIMLYSIRYN
ncbi:MAG: energy-coupled thiamine transporter ThiT, partial [Oscillospiraceae bacterium]